MLRVIEYFAKSLKSLNVSQNDTLEQDVCKTLLVFHIATMSISRTVSETFSGK